ncbi:hypothetical protein [Streptomyces sp. NPDC012888]|uniref:hypothetical protein n=1 Tax=Streptomyces sp. NPDC012888 TaxID=3364855 RepID=UPI0036CD0E72
MSRYDDMSNGARELLNNFDEIDLAEMLAARPAERCGAQLPSLDGGSLQECVLRPGHQGSHATHDDTRWVEKPAAGYCPHCGRGDVAPTADAYEQQRQRAEQAEVALALLHAGEEPHLDEHTVPTPAQWIWRWNRATPEQRLEVTERIIAEAERASTCLLMAHEKRLPDAEAALARVRALATDAMTHHAAGSNDYEIGVHDFAHTALAALDLQDPRP